MNNSTILIKVKNRLNKISSQDFSNLPSWNIVEAFNKGQLQWCRRNLHGTNSKQEGDEKSTSRIDDLQKLIKTLPKIMLQDKGVFYQTSDNSWPKDYLRYKRISALVTKECCPKPKPIQIYLGEEDNVELYLRDANVKPDYAWAETFATITGNRLNIYHDNQFDMTTVDLVYYRKPLAIQIAGVVDLSTGTSSLVNMECEFNDDLTELLIDESASILAFDMENQIQAQRLTQDTEKNN